MNSTSTTLPIYNALQRPESPSESDSSDSDPFNLTPHVTCHIRGVEKVYLTVDIPHNHLCLVFTCAKTQEAVNSVFRSGRFPEMYVPGAACEESAIYWSIDLEGPSHVGINNIIQELITNIGNQVSPNEPSRELPLQFYLPRRW